MSSFWTSHLCFTLKFTVTALTGSFFVLVLFRPSGYHLIPSQHVFCIHQRGHFHLRAQKWPLSDAKPRQITVICASVSRILVWLRTLPPTRRHPSLWVPSPTRSSELCAPVAMLTRTSHLSSSSYVRRKASEWGGLQYTQTYAPPTHPSAPYHTMLRRNCGLGLRRRFANQLTYCMSTRVPSSH